MVTYEQIVPARIRCDYSTVVRRMMRRRAALEEQVADDSRYLEAVERAKALYGLPG